MSDNNLILSRKNLSTVSFAVGIPYGAANEDVSGITNVMTSHLFRNTASKDEKELASFLDKHGIVTFDQVNKTGFWIGMNTPPQNLPIALDLFEEILFNPEFKEDTTMKLVQQQKGSLAQMEQIPQARLFQRTRWEAAFGESKISRNPSGTAEDLDKVSPSTLENNYETIKEYRPQFVAVGIDISDNQFSNTIAKLEEFGSKDGSIELRDSNVPSLNSQVDKMAAQTSNAYLGINLLSQGHNESKYEDEVYKNILSGGFSARFFTEIRDERNLSYSVFALNSKYHDFGLITSGMDVRPDRAEEGRDVALRIMKEVLHENIDDDEMNRALKAAQKTALFVSDSSQSYTGWLMGRRLQGLETDLNVVNDKIKAASELDWQEKILSYWKKENFSLAIAGEPGKAAETWEEAVEKVL